MQGLDSKKALAMPGSVVGQRAAIDKASIEGGEEEEKAIKYSSFQTSFSKEHGTTTAGADHDM